MATNLLADIELNDKQIKAFNEELNNWKQKTKDQLAEEVKTEIQTEYDVKVRQLEEEKNNFKQEQVDLVEEIKTKMQKVMVKRFTTALKEMYDELKVEARKDVLSDPRILALEEIKNVIFPLMDETVTKGYVDELQKALQMIEQREDENDRLKAMIKLKEITANLSPVVAEAVEAFIGEATTEEEVVEKYSKLKNLVKEADKSDDEEDDEEPKKKKSKKSKDDEDDDEDKEDDDEDDEDDKDDDYEIDEAKKSKKSKKSDDDDEDKDDDEDDEDDEADDKEDDDDDEDKDDIEEDLEINPMIKFDRNKDDNFNNELNELLRLADIR